MEVRKAVVTAAAADQRSLPLQTLIDPHSQPKTALQLILDEIVSAGIDEIALVIHPGDQVVLADAARDVSARLTFIEQTSPRGYGHALALARDFIGGAPFLHMVGDHLYISHGSQTCAKQLVDLAAAESCAVSAVQPVRESLLPYYGIIGGRRLGHSRHLYRVETVIEKPTPTEAEQKLLIPGLRAGHYLSFFGMHVLTGSFMEILTALVDAPATAAAPLSPALDRLTQSERYLAVDVGGRRYDIGARYGLLIAQLALALSGDDRDEILAQLVELLATCVPSRTD